MVELFFQLHDPKSELNELRSLRVNEWFNVPQKSSFLVLLRPPWGIDNPLPNTGNGSRHTDSNPPVARKDRGTRNSHRWDRRQSKVIRLFIYLSHNPRVQSFTIAFAMVVHSSHSHEARFGFRNQALGHTRVPFQTHPICKCTIRNIHTIKGETTPIIHTTRTRVAKQIQGSGFEYSGTFVTMLLPGQDENAIRIAKDCDLRGLGVR